MAADTIRRIFFNPSVAIARLGGSATPLDAFEWGPGDPHTVAETRILPRWTLDVRPDGSVSPRLPRRLTLRDGALLRPLAPFIELWALTGDGDVPANWSPVPVTTALLAANGATTASLSFTVEAMNRKAERRGPRGGGRDPALLRFGTFPPVRIAGNDHRPVDLLGTSPPDATRPMIPRGRSIPLGRLQVLRPAAQPRSPRWPDDVRIDVVRIRFIPARGRFYGPPAAAQVVAGAPAPAVPASRAFLEPDAGWFEAPRSNRTVPADTVDETETGLSLGVVDDTCDARLVAELPLAAGPMRARANVSVGPPQYAPDRRPFLSLADEINDREHDPQRDQSLTDEELGRWIEDLFERVFETVLAMDVDWWRALSARQLAPDERRSSAVAGDGVPQPERAMGGLDRLRDPDIAIPPPSPNQTQPLSQRARDRHRNLSDLKQLVAFVRAQPDRIERLVRPTFASPQRDQNGQSMQMPPFMRNSNAQALSLARWQYDLLLRWVADVTAPGADILAEGDVVPLSEAAAERRRQILAALDDGGDGS